jgi:MFS superfamily sulfate permease-like transporter
MEQDKMIITLSSAAIALLITIITAVRIRGFWQHFFAMLAVLGFIFAICSCLHIFQFNAKHLEESLRNQNTESTSKLLKSLDKLTIFSFYAGIACIVLMAMLISFQKARG